MKKRGRNYTIGERAIITIAALAGSSLDEINNILIAEQAKAKSGSEEKRKLNKNSFDMLKKRYFPRILEIENLHNDLEMTESDFEKMQYTERVFDGLLQHILSPKSVSDLD